VRPHAEIGALQFVRVVENRAHGCSKETDIWIIKRSRNKSKKKKKSLYKNERTFVVDEGHHGRAIGKHRDLLDLLVATSPALKVQREQVRSGAGLQVLHQDGVRRLGLFQTHLGAVQFPLGDFSAKVLEIYKCHDRNIWKRYKKLNDFLKN